MKKFLGLAAVLFFCCQDIEAQSKQPRTKTDTAKTKANSLVKTDTITKPTRVPFVSHVTSLDKIDDAELAQALGPDKSIRQYGYIDTSDLKMSVCDFEKDANAMVIFDHGIMACGVPNVLLLRHKRIKIFNENGKGEANIRIEFNNRFGAEHILMVEAETITLEDGKIVYTKLDPKLIYTEHTNKEKDAITFSMPNVKPGSVIEYQYLWARPFSRNIPQWIFQNDLPTKYSQLDAFLESDIVFTALSKKNGPYVKDDVTARGMGHVWALENVPSTKDEPYMRSATDALQSLTLIIKSVKIGSKETNIWALWTDVGKEIAEDKDFYKPYDQSFSDEDNLVKQARALHTTDEKVAFAFNQVKTQMKWNEDKNWYSKDGIKTAWKKKSGSWGEINMIVCRLLKSSGINAYPMLVSTRDNGSLLPNFVNLYQINKLVAYVPVDSTKFYVLDASDKFSVYNEIPYDLLNSNGLVLNKDQHKYELLFMKKDAPVLESVLINAEIKPDGSMNGNAQIASYSYNKSIDLELHKKLEEKEYFQYLTNNDNNVKITSLKLAGADTDSVPLVQDIEFKMDLAGTDEKYIYFNPNLFTALHTNPFINEKRISDIDFGSKETYSINGRYKIPDGYKTESIPKSVTLVIRDKSIIFKRMTAMEDSIVVIHYVISYSKSLYPQEEYGDIYLFFKKCGKY